MTFRSLFKKLLLINTFLLSCIALPAQVMWNLKGGLMQATEHHVDEILDKHRLNWMAGLEIEIPLSQKLNLETGLRYKNETLCLTHYYHYYHWTSDDDHDNHLELPLRLAYKQKLGENFSIHAGIGPYIATSLKKAEVDEINTIRVGIEPSIALNWKCLSLGLTYNNPCFYKGYKKELDDSKLKYKENSGLMLTLGIRFGSDKWKYVGTGLAAVATVGAAVGSVYAASQGDYSGSSYSSSSYSSSSDYSSSSSSNYDNGSKSQAASGNNKKMSEVVNKNTDSNTYSKNETLLINMSINRKDYDKNRKDHIQDEMKKIRTKWEQKGYKMYHSKWEDWNGE